ncbi:hypothetical protein [Enterocloster citroniae]|uniref:hypothetical protein n=1 Tax=Enterocloster citroniae TaxID=358743 RepID=UPI00349E5D26
MATVDEILTRQAYAAGDETWTKDNNYPSYTMYAEPEYVPVTNKRIADFNDQISVRGEQNAQFVGFQLPRYDDAMDLTKQNLYIHYQTVYGGSDGVPCNVSWSDNYVRMCWMIPGQATQEPGSIQMMIYATGTDSVGDRTVWKTLPATYTIHDGLEIGGGIPEPDQSWYEQFVQQMEGKVSTAQGYANDAQASKVAAAGSATAAAQSADASAQALAENKDYVESQKETFVGYNKRETDLKYANALIGSASGTGRVTVEDAWEAPIPDLEVAGKSDQFTTTGAQLFDASLIPALTAGGVTVEGTADGGYHISGSGDSGTFYKTVKITDLTMLKAGNIMLKSESSVPKFSVRLMDSSSTILFELTADQTRTITEEMLSTEGVYLQYMFYGAVSNVTPGTYYPMLYQDGDGTWEPYTGGQPSPSPEYPQPIISTGTVTTGAQLLPPDNIYSGFLTSADGARSNDNNYRTVWLSLSTGTYTIAIGGGGVIVKTVIDGILNNSSTSIADGAGYTCTLTQDGYLGISFRKQDSTEYTEEPQVMLNTGSTTKPWEPYTGGKPSPSEAYPQPLDVTVTGENLFDKSKIPNKTTEGATVTNNGDGSFTVAGTGTLPVAFSNIISLTHEETMTLIKSERTFTVYSNVSVYPYFFFNFYDKNGTVKTLQLTGVTKVTESIPNAADMDTLYIKFGYYGMAGEAIVADTQKVMVNAGSTALPWQPYQSKSATIPLTAPLHGIGDVRDRIMCKDGVWGMERYISHYKLPSDIVSASCGGVATANDVIDNRYTTICCNTLRSVIKKELYSNSKKTIGFCNIALPGMVKEWNISKDGKENIYTINSLGDMYISIPTSSLGITADATREEVTAAVKQYVTDHDVYVAFVLDAPTWEPLPAATQTALNALTTFTGTTHITITAGGPEPDVAVEYVQDTRAVIADIMAQIDTIRNGGTT